MKAQPRPLAVAASLLSTAVLLLTLSERASAQPANFPWAMFHHDVCHTGQSPNPGPKFTSAGPSPTDVTIWHGYDKIRTSPSLSKDGKTIYFGMGFDFCSVDVETTPFTTNDCFRLPADVSDSSPAVAADGTIYMGDRDNTLNAFTSMPDRTLKLKWDPGYNRGHEGDIWQSVAIAPAGVPAAGTIYFTHDQTTDGVGMFTALRDNGTSPTVKWKYKVGSFVRQSSPAIDKNGIIYFGDLNGYIYAFEDRGDCPDDNLMCNNSNPLNPTTGPVRIGKRLVGSAPSITASPVISKDSTTLYIGSTTGLTALDITDPESCWASNPQPPCAPSPVRWRFPIAADAAAGVFPANSKVDQTPALARDGTLYVPVMTGGSKSLYAVNPINGAKKWVFGPISSGSETSAYPIVGGDGTVYVGLGTTIYALNPATGAQYWKYATTNFIQSSPLIGPITNGKAVLYVPSRDHNLYGISGSPSGSTNPTTCWSAAPPSGNEPPVADAGPDQSVLVDQVVTFDGHLSFDPNGTPLTFTWNFGDGTGLASCQASSSACAHPTHKYTQVNPDLSGFYTATLTVSDGQLSDSDTVKIAVAASGGGGGTTFQDNFTRNDSDALGPGGSGPQWAEPDPLLSTLYKGNLVIKGGKLKNCLPPLASVCQSARGDNIGYLPALSSSADQSASGDFTSTDNNSAPHLGVLLRYQNDRNHYRLYRAAGGSSQLRISKLVNGVETVLKSTNIALPTANTPFHLRGRVSGATLELFLGLGTTPMVTFTEATPTYASGAIGVLVKTGSLGTHEADNFCAAVGPGTCP